MLRHSRAIAILLSGLIFAGSMGLSAAPQENSQAQTTIACSILEIHASRDLGVSAAVFHQANKDDAARFGALMKEYAADASVEFQTKDGVWHKASSARLKSSFGRGLLLFASASAQLKDKDTFLLRFLPN